jgi:hypothetical protein
MTSHARTETADTYEAHGLRLRSDTRLFALPQTHHIDADVILNWDEPAPFGEGVLPGAELLRFAPEGQLRYSAADDGDVLRLRFAECCEFTVSRDLRHVRCRPAPSVDPGLAVVLAEGALMAFLLSMGHHCVLHASAVQVGDGVIALVGSSGLGKSTVAAALCATGCNMVTDDVLRVDLSTEPVAFRGTSELRLRPGAHGIVERFQAPVSTRQTADGRLALRPPPSTESTMPLRAMVVPRPSRHLGQVQLERVTGAQALSRLISFPRLLGWRAETALRQQFVLLSQLARQVPLFEARLPWGPPFTHSASRDLVDALSLGISRSGIPAN